MLCRGLDIFFSPDNITVLVVRESMPENRIFRPPCFQAGHVKPALWLTEHESRKWFNTSIKVCQTRRCGTLQTTTGVGFRQMSGLAQVTS